MLLCEYSAEFIVGFNRIGKEVHDRRLKKWLKRTKMILFVIPYKNKHDNAKF